MSGFEGTLHSSMESHMGFHLGSRVCDGEGFRATVRYIGPLAAAKNKEEVWLGLEWDDATRGKHDGSCVDEHGVLFRYFQCAYGAGSFVKPSKVSAGRALVEALHERYVSIDAPPIVEEDGKLPDGAFATSKGNLKSIEFYGEKKLRHRQQLSTMDKVAVRNGSVSVIGEGLARVAAHMVEIDLQDNLLWRWDEVIKLGVEVPALRALLLHGNKMEPLSNSIIERVPTGCFANLQVLALNGCNITSWADVQRLEPLLPQLRELYLAHNKLPDLHREDAEQAFRDATGQSTEPPLEVTGFNNLRILDLAFCGLEEWSQVQSFGKLPMLTELVLGGNPLPSVVAAQPETFPALHRLSLGGTKLSSWADVDSLGEYSQLQTLRLSQIPLFAHKGASEVRPIIIARLPRLASLNGSTISARERADAEKIYLRSILREKDALLRDGHQRQAEDIDKGLRLLHPLYELLWQRHGEYMAPSGASSGGSGSGSMASEMVSVTFRNLSFGSGGTLEPITKRLPKSVQISKLRLLVKQLFGLEPRLQQLSMRVYKDAPPTPLDDDMSTLQFFGVVDGAEIFVNEDKE